MCWSPRKGRGMAYSDIKSCFCGNPCRGWNSGLAEVKGQNSTEFSGATSPYNVYLFGFYYVDRPESEHTWTYGEKNDTNGYWFHYQIETIGR